MCSFSVCLLGYIACPAITAISTYYTLKSSWRQLMFVFFLPRSCLLARFSEVKMEEGCNKRRGKRERSGGSDVFLMKTNHTTGITHRVQNTHGGVPTCSLTEARMEEVVSVSVLSPLEAGITGATMAPFSCSAGCSGTGIAIMNRNMHEEDTPLARSVNLKGAKQQAITITSS